MSRSAYVTCMYTEKREMLEQLSYITSIGNALLNY